MQSDPRQIDSSEAQGGLPKDSVAVTVRRTILFVLAISAAYLLVWVPWRDSRVSLVLFLGFGMIQIAAVYTQESRDDPVSVVTAPPLFLNPLMSLFVSGMALVGFVVELIIGFESKPWWEALLLPIPPFLFTGVVLFPRHNPAPPFFVGVAALLVALVLKIM